MHMDASFGLWRWLWQVLTASQELQFAPMACSAVKDETRALLFHWMSGQTSRTALGLKVDKVPVAVGQPPTTICHVAIAVSIFPKAVGHAPATVINSRCPFSMRIVQLLCIVQALRVVHESWNSCASQPMRLPSCRGPGISQPKHITQRQSAKGCVISRRCFGNG